MALVKFQQPIEYLNLTDVGKPVANGLIYFGEADSDPETDPKLVYLVQEDGTNLPLTLGEPVSTNAGGNPQYEGSPAWLKIESPYSYRVRDSSGVEVFYVANVTEDEQDPNPGNVKQYTTVADMVADTSLSEGDLVETAFYYGESDFGGGKWRITTNTEIPSPNEWNEKQLTGTLVADLITGDTIVIDQFGASSDVDCQGPIQAAIFKGQEGKLLSPATRRTITSAGQSYPIRSVYTGSLPSWAAGDTLALWLEDGEFCHFDFNMGTIYLDITQPAVAGITAVIGVVQESGDQANLNWNRIRVSGGNWTTDTDRPEFNVKLDYNVLKYSEFNSVHCFYARTANFKGAGFAVNMTRCEARFASETANYQIFVDAVDGDGATRTSWTLTNCRADFAALYGFQMVGGNGHTYCVFNTCYADHIGRDDDNNTITANVADAAAYRLSAAFGVSLISCGSEFSTRYGRFSGARSLKLQTCYTNAMGTTEGSTVDGLIKVDGFCEQNDYTQLEVGSNLTNVDNYLYITKSSTFNNNSIHKNYGIPDNQIAFENTGTDSSAPSLITDIGHFYQGGVRNPGGDDLVSGDPIIGTDSSEWVDQSNYAAERHFRHQTDDTGTYTFPILTLTNPTNQGTLGIVAKVFAARSQGTIPELGTEFLIRATANAGTNVVSIDTLGTAGTITSVTPVWNGDTLEISMTETFASVLIEAKAVGRPSTGTQTFNWG